MASSLEVALTELPPPLFHQKLYSRFPSMLLSIRAPLLISGFRRRFFDSDALRAAIIRRVAAFWAGVRFFLLFAMVNRPFGLP
jgi:hypothetical protein